MSEKKFYIPELNDTVLGSTIDFSVKNPNEASLLQCLTQALSEGDKKAWEELYLLLYDPVAAFINSLIRSKEEASDLTQEVFIKLWENAARIDPQKNIRAYIYAMARGFSYNHLRERSKQRSFTPIDHLPEISIPDIAPDDLLIADELQLLVAIALESMPPQRKRIFEMSRYEGLNHDEIASKLQLSKRTVESHIYVALKELKEVLYIAAILLITNA